MGDWERDTWEFLNTAAKSKMKITCNQEYSTPRANYLQIKP